MNFHLYTVLLISLIASSISCLGCFVVNRLFGFRIEDEKSGRLTAFAVLLTLAIILFSGLLIFSNYWNWMIELSRSDLVYFAIFFVIFSLCGIFWRVFLPICVSVYILYIVLVFCSLSVFCKSYANEQILEINSDEVVYSGEKLNVDFDFSKMQLSKENQDLVLVVNAYRLPQQMILPFASVWFKPVALTDRRYTEQGIQNDLFVVDPLKKVSGFTRLLYGFSSFFYDFLVMDENYQLFNEEYFVSIPVSAFYPHIFKVKFTNKNNSFLYKVERVQ